MNVFVGQQPKDASPKKISPHVDAWPGARRFIKAGFKPYDDACGRRNCLEKGLVPNQVYVWDGGALYPLAFLNLAGHPLQVGLYIHSQRCGNQGGKIGIRDGPLVFSHLNTHCLRF